VAVCDASGTRLAYGHGSTRKKAEQMAAQAALPTASV
jgi:dsRNA-specific ribonuclease